MTVLPLGDTDDIDLELRGDVLWISLDRPARLNAITPAMSRELLATFRALETAEEVRVVVLRGRGRGFCAGLDLTHAGDRSGDRVHLPDVILAMRACPQPVIAAVHGPACGGGFAFALAADVRIAGASARMNDAFVNLGVSGCEMGTSYFLPRIVGLSVASELMYTGRFIDAERALATQLVSEVVPDDDLEQAATQMAEDMCRVAPLALALTKRTLGHVLQVDDLAVALALEDAAQAACVAGPDFDEGVQAFLEGRRPRFTSGSGPAGSTDLRREA